MRAAQLHQVAAEQAALLRTLRTLRTATPVHARVMAVYCAHCRRWRKPTKFHPFAKVCRSCPGGGPILLDQPGEGRP